MGIYEDGGPGTPSAANTATFQSIPYNCEPELLRQLGVQEPQPGGDADRGLHLRLAFPVIVGNSGAVTPSVSMSLAADRAKAFRLTDARAGVTLRAGDPTLKDITYSSTTPDRLTGRLHPRPGGGRLRRARALRVGDHRRRDHQGLAPGRCRRHAQVQTTITGDSLTLEVNTDVAMEMPTPQYGKNAVVWGMFLLSRGLGAVGSDLQLEEGRRRHHRPVLP